MIGQGELLGGLSYVAIGRETVTGTYNTCTALLPVMNFGIVTTKDNKIVEQIARSRTYSQRTPMMKKIGGDIGFYFQPQLDACAFILQNAFIGTVTSATTTGETNGAGASSAMDHTFNIGETYQSHTSLCINTRKGPTTTGRVFQYSGVRVNEINFQAELNDALKVTANMIGMDSTQVSNDVSGGLGNTETSLLSFVDGRLSVEASFGSLTSSSYWHVQSIEFGWSNNLKADQGSGRIGSDILQVLPAGMVSFTMRAKMRFDTMTAYDAMIASTQLAMQLDFRGPTMTGSSIRQGLRFDMPKVLVHNAGDSKIGGPNEILTADVEFHILRDTATGYALRGVLTNQKTSYA